jgi:hypothetical protein
MRAEAHTTEIRRRLATGLLPGARRCRTYAGRSLGGRCDGCGAEIARNAVEYSVDLLDDLESVTRTVTMHAHCHVIWMQVSSADSRELTVCS